MRNTTVDLEELGEDMTTSKYEELISALTDTGVALRDVNGEYRSTYDIMSDLAKKWDSLTSMQKAALATNIAGTRQQNVFYSLIEQFQEASGAMDAMSKSAGTLDESYGKYLDSVEGKISQLTATFQAFSQDVLGSSTVGTILSITQGLVNVLDVLSKIHLLLPLIIAAVTIWRGLNAASAVTQLTSKLIIQNGVTEQDITATQALTNSQKMLMSQQIALAVESGILTEEQGEQLLMQTGLNGAMGTGIGVSSGLAMSLRGLWTVIKANPLGLILTAITLIISAFQIVSDQIEQAKQEAYQANQELISENKTLLQQKNAFLTNAGVIEAYLKKTSLTSTEESNLQSAIDSVSTALGGKKIALDETKEKQQEYLQLLKDTAEEEKKAALTAARKSAQAAYSNLEDAAGQKVAATGDRVKSDVDNEIVASAVEMRKLGRASYDDMVEWYSEAQADAIERLSEEADRGLLEFRYHNNDAMAIGIADDLKDDTDALLEYYTLLTSIQDMMAEQDDTDNKTYDAITAAINQIKDEAEAAYEAMAQVLLLENPPGEGVKTYEEYTKYIDAFLASSDEFADKTPEYIELMRSYLYALGSEYPQAIENATDATQGASVSLDELKKKLSDVSKEIDNIQSAYDTVMNLIEDYNKNGYLSLDHLQKLLALEPEYLNLLIDENGQINLNSESYARLAKAKLEEMLITQIRTTLSTILNMSAEEAAAYATAKAYDTETESLYALIQAETQAALTSAYIKDAAEHTTAHVDAVKRYAATIPTLVGLVENYDFATEHATNATGGMTDALNEQKDALEDARDAWKDYQDELKDAQEDIQDLIDLVMAYIKQQKEDEKEVLQERKEAFDDLIDKEKEELRLKKEAADFEAKLKSKQNSVAKDALAAAVARLDDSAAGRKAQKQANDALFESRDDLHNILADHEYDIRISALEKLQEAQDAYYEAEIKKIDDYLDNERQLYEDACKMIENDTGSLYGTLWAYTYRYTTKTRAEFDHMWSSAQAALEKYGGAHAGVFNIMEFLQREIYNTETQIGRLDGAIDSISKQIDNLGNNSISGLTSQINGLKSALDALGAPKWYFHWNGQDWTSAIEDQTGAIYDILNQLGWDTRGGNFVKQNMHHYASGTFSAAGGPSVVNEDGHEIRVLNKGDGILTAQITKNLSALGSDPSQFIADAGKQLLSQLSSIGTFQSLFGGKSPAIFGTSSSPDQPISITNHIQGDVNPSTLRALEAAQERITKKAVNDMMSQTLIRRRSSRV